MVRVSILGWAVVCGAALGLGLWSLASLTPALGRPRLANRIAPYIGDVSEQARILNRGQASGPLPVLGVLLTPLGEGVRRVADAVLGGGETVELRLRQSGSVASVAEFRAQQLVWALCGLAVGVVLAALAAGSGSAPTVALLGLALVGAAAGFVARDWVLQRAAKARLARVASELPTVLEFLTLSLAAGEGILDSIRRVSGRGNGELSAEFSHVAAQVAAGVPLARALTDLADGIRLPALTRFIDQATGALERGTPLVDTLRAQAQDARDQAKRDLIEVAGRKEVAMLMPLVFLILPTTVVFAIFPGIFVLQLGF